MPTFYDDWLQAQNQIQTDLKASLEVARDNDLASIAFPAISTGVYGYPAGAAAKVAVGMVGAVLAADDGFDKVVFCCFSEASAALHRVALEATA